MTSHNHLDSLYSILRGMIREEIDRTPGFRELTGRSRFPASPDAEKTILGAILLDDMRMKELADLQADDFSLDSHQLIFMKMQELSEGKHAIDIVTLANAFGEKDVKEIGGVAYLASLTEGLPRRPVITEYIAIMQEKAKLRRIWSACQAAIEKCRDQDLHSVEIVGQLGVALKGIRGKK